MDILKSINNACRFILEVVAVFSVGYWGFKLHTIGVWKYVVGIGAPFIIMTIWSIFGAPMAAHRLEVFYRFVLEILIFSVAVACLYNAHQKTLATVVGIIILINTALLYLLR